MVTGVLDLAEVTVEDVMVHRSNMFTVNIDDDPNKSGIQTNEVDEFFDKFNSFMRQGDPNDPPPDGFFPDKPISEVVNFFKYSDA